MKANKKNVGGRPRLFKKSYRLTMKEDTRRAIGRAPTKASEATAAKSVHATLVNIINSPIIHITINNVSTLDGDIVRAKTVNHVNSG